MRELGDRPSMATYEDDSDADVAAEPVSSGDVPLEEISSPSTDQTADVAAAEKSFDEAIDRLAESGRLTPATEEALDAAIAGAPPQDWPDIIAAFVSGIESTPRPRRTALRPLEEPVAATATPAPQEPVPPASQPSPSPAAPAVTAPPVSVAPSATAPPREPQPPSRPPLALVNPCFASRVQGWGAVDRFASSRFLPGQELIVYFELEHLAADASPAGHTTRIDTRLQLVGSDGRRLHEWRFEPVAETCPTHRRDYFARYVLRIPEQLPSGACRLDLAVTDTVAHCTALASLPLEITDRVQ